MVDIVDRETRSRMMSGIHGMDTQPEIFIRRLLHNQGFRFRLHARELPGKPDIVLPRYHAVIFVNGCFWHGHNCSFFKWPSTRAEFWKEKILKNQENDQKNILSLQEAGWRVGVIWECATRRKNFNNLSPRIARWLRGNRKFLEICE